MSPGDGERAAFGLGHLAGLLLQGHPGEQVVDALLHRQLGVQVRQAVRVDDDLRGLGGRLGAGDGELERDGLGGLGGPVLRVRTAIVREVPDAVPAGKVILPETGV